VRTYWLVQFSYFFVRFEMKFWINTDIFFFKNLKIMFNPVPMPMSIKIMATPCTIHDKIANDLCIIAYAVKENTGRKKLSHWNWPGIHWAHWVKIPLKKNIWPKAGLDTALFISAHSGHITIVTWAQNKNTIIANIPIWPRFWRKCLI